MANMPMCMTKDAKALMIRLIEQKKPYELLALTVQDVLPSCEDLEALGIAMKTTVAKEKTRTAPEAWPAATLYKEDGSSVSGSLSGLFKDTFGVAVTEDKVCRLTESGEADCRSISAVENWQGRGFAVHGNGDPAPAVTAGMSTGAIDKMFKAWKDKLLQEGKAINIYHPKALEPKEEVKKRQRKQRS